MSCERVCTLASASNIQSSSSSLTDIHQPKTAVATLLQLSKPPSVLPFLYKFHSISVRMAEALGVASGLAGFICLGLTVCRGLIDYYTSYRDTNSTVKTLCASIEALNEILLILDGIQNKAFDQDVVNQVKKCIDSCQEGLDFLSRKLKETTQKSTSKLATLTSPFKEKTLDKLKKTCDDLQNILKLALHALQMWAIYNSALTIFAGIYLANSLLT